MGNIFEQWEQGDVTDQDALRALVMDLGELEDELTPLERDRKTLRSRIERIVLHAGGKAQVAGFGQLVVLDAVQVASYDARALDALVADLILTQPEMAARIAGTRKEPPRAARL